ncbi:uncharacterized protein LOC135397460 [Ornithodoros turicata]|uniref:uncharacterized protein LOC135397460 n=1 Tax=Ornithodoros turicata TaxID=34597 RepID=UPI0031388FF5
MAVQIPGLFISIMVYLVLCVSHTHSELFTAIAHLEALLPTERAIARAVRGYYDSEIKRMKNLESYLDGLVLLQSQNITYESHPIWLFLAASRMTWSWTDTYTTTLMESSVNADDATVGGNLPTAAQEDLTGAAVGLCRLAEAYKLTTEEMVRMKSSSVNEPSASDLKQIADRCFDADDFKGAASWLEEAMKRLETETYPSASREEMAEALAYTKYLLGDLKAALRVIEEQLHRTPLNDDLLEKQAIYLERLKNGDSERQEPPATDAKRFQELCLDDINGPSSPPTLTCKLTTNGGQPLLLLEPLKMEIVNKEPNIFVFHNFLTKQECKELRGLSSPLLQRALVDSGRGQQRSGSRVAKLAWFDDCEHTVVTRTVRRITAATGLMLHTAELLQIVHYGVGGHYATHLDHEEEFNSTRPRRLATWLTYLSDVTSGGATVFTVPRVPVRPEEGKAVFWFNLQPDPDKDAIIGPWGEMRKSDRRMYHAACPVLQGSKWTATRWFHEDGQGKILYGGPRYLQSPVDDPSRSSIVGIARLESINKPSAFTLVSCVVRFMVRTQANESRLTIKKSVTTSSNASRFFVDVTPNNYGNGIIGGEQRHQCVRTTMGTTFDMAKAFVRSCVVGLLFFFAHKSTADVFTATVHLQPLLMTDNFMTIIIRRYLDAEDTRIALMESYHAELTLLESLNHTDALTEFMIISRLSWTWLRGTDITTQAAQVNAEGTFIDATVPTATEEDLEGAAAGLCRLVTAYELSVKQMIHLRTPGVERPSVSDLITVGKRCYAASDFKTAALWFQEAIEDYDNSEDVMVVDINREEIAKDLSLLLFVAGEARKALQVVNEQLSLTPNDEELLQMRNIYQNELTNSKASSRSEDANASFYKLCLRDREQFSSELYCKVTTNGGHAWLLLQPLRMEVVSVQPRIVVLHDFLTSKECRLLRYLATPVLSRAYVYQGIDSVHYSGRIGKVTWFQGWEDPAIQRILRRAEAVTGLSDQASVPIQIANYGVGGHYVPHHDSRPRVDARDDTQYLDGSRLATLLMYISDVTAGGATAFTWPRLTVKPKEGKAVFWYNLLPDPRHVTEVGRWGEVRTGDTRTEHGSCPVLQGSKWIATKWFRERGQGHVHYDRPI